MTIRPFNPDTDYPAFAALGETVEPEYTATADEMRRNDERRPERCKFFRFLAEIDGAVVGSSSAGNSVWSFDPKKFSVRAQVIPEVRNRGIGRALFQAALDAVAPFEPIGLTSFTRSDRPDAVHFLESRGFVEAQRERESRVAMATIDLSGFADADEKPLGAGIRLTDFGTLIAESGEDAWRKLHALDIECAADIPMPEGETHTPQPFDEWRKWGDDPNFRPAGFQIAVAPDGSFAGVSMLMHPEKGDYLSTGLTGVARAFRRHGIATALKVRAMRYALAQGVAEVRTENAQQNRGMISINDRLGFVPQPDWVHYRKDIASVDAVDSVEALIP